MAARVRMYTTLICPYCIRAKMLLKAKGVAYEEIDVSGDHDKRAWLVKATGLRTVPQIFINEESVGGFDELRALDRAGQLDAKLAQPATAAS
jgi:glutaredoxin 3